MLEVRRRCVRCGLLAVAIGALVGCLSPGWDTAEVATVQATDLSSQRGASFSSFPPLSSGSPVTPEDAAKLLRSVGAPLANLAAYVSKPGRLSLERMEAFLLWPLALRLKAVSSPAPAPAAAALQQACDLMAAGFECPELFVVEREGGMELETLPLPPFRRERRFAIFASGGFIAEVQPSELKALLLRQVALLMMFHLYIPEPWALWQAVQPRPARATQHRPKGLGLQAKKRSQTNSVEGVMRWVALQFMELCRVLTGLRVVLENAPRMPSILQAPVGDLGDRLDPHWPQFDGAEIVAAYSEGNGPAVKETIDKAKSIAVRWKFPEMYRCWRIADEANLIPNEPIQPKLLWSQIQRAYKVDQAS